MEQPDILPAGLPAALDADIELSENALTVLRKRYLLRGPDGEPAETPALMFWRVAGVVAAPDAEYGDDPRATARAFYNVLTSFRFMPNSPTFTGAGTPLGQLAACFTGEMRVTTTRGVKRIDQLEIGDQVLTHAGRYRPVTHLFRRAYDGELLRIKVGLVGTALEVTPEHPILTEKGWIKAGDLQVGDRVAIGFPKGTRVAPRFDLATSEYADEKVSRSLRLTLSNPGLIQQIWQMCLRLGYDAAIRPVDTTYVTPNAGETAQIGMPPLQSRDLVKKTFGIDLPEPDERYIRTKVVRDNEQVYFRVEAITSQDYSGAVYNCEVGEDHSYVTEGVVVHNCFVLPLEDDMGRDPAGIFSTLRMAALIQQTGGGNGFSFSRLRPKGARVSTSQGVATGPVGFLRVYDKAFGEIAQGGSRRGANMAVLRIDHPDIQEFIRCKSQEGDIVNFNISVGITDAFMRAVEADQEYDLVNPQDGSVWRRLCAREVFNEIVRHAHRNGEPGVLFLDTANRSNPLPHLYELEATNPCIAGDTLVAVADGRGNVPIAQLAEEGKDVPVFTRTDTATVTIRMMRNPRITGYREPVFLITLDDGSIIRATGTHKFLVCGGEYKQVRDLQSGDSLWMMSRYKASLEDIFKANSNSQDYMWISHGQRGVKAEHRLIAEFHYNTGLRTGLVVHHRDYDSLNDMPDNLEIMTKEAHDQLHAQDMMGDNNPMRVAQTEWSDEQWAAYRDKLSQSLAGHNNPRFSGVTNAEVREHALALATELQRAFSVQEWAEYAASVGIPQQFSKWRNDHLGGIPALARWAARKAGIAAFDIDPRTLRFYQELEDQGYDVDVVDGRVVVHKNCEVCGRPFTVPGKRREIALCSTSCSNKSASSPFSSWTDLQDAARANSQNHKVVSVECVGEETVYNGTVDEFHNFFVGGWKSKTTNGKDVWYYANNLQCGEQWLGSYENCCLGSVNLARHVTPEGGVDWPKLRETVELATRFLDNVVDANKYVPAVPEIEEAARRTRRIGLGVMGLGDLMFAAGIRYGSPAGEEFAAQVMEFVRFHAMRVSVELAQQRGPFPAIEGSFYDPTNLQWRPPAPLSPYGSSSPSLHSGLRLRAGLTPGTHTFGRPPLDWNDIVQGIRAHGIRNAATTTVAPTGTVATVSGCEAYGCEPVFALAYVRHFKDGDQDVELTYTSPLFLLALERAGLDEHTRQRIVQQVSLTGSCQDIADVPAEIRHVFVVANDISAEEHVRMQATIQAFVDSSISKTINFPQDAIPEDIARAYHLAWRLGCKGLTVYVTGSREKVVLETQKTRQAREESGYQAEPRKPRPMVLHGTTYRTPTPLGTAYITINENGDHDPFEVFANVGKAGSDTAAVAEAIGRLISLALRMPSPLSSRERMTEIIDQLAGIGGGRPMGFGPNRVRSLPDAVAQVLARHIALVEAEQPPEQLKLPLPEPKADLCPDCGQASYVALEGCRKCLNCGYSEC